MQQPAERLMVLLVEDTPDHADLAELALDEPDPQGSFGVIRTSRLAEALPRLDGGGVDVVLLDLILPDSEGLATFNAVRDHAPSVPIVVMSALDDEELALEAVREGAQDYLVKGANL